MPLAKVLEKLYSRRRFGIKPGVDRVRRLLDSLGHPDRTFRSIHVVGTNGKGSTSAFLASILSSAGLRTALFTSPHLVSFNERFRINGREIPSDKLAPLIDTVLAATTGDETFFEIVTAMAACYFADEQVEIAIMEAGMGGRSDATAALNGISTVITPVSLDHCDYLGTTLAEIAREKGGIAKPGTPVIIGPQQPDAGNALAELFQSGSNPLTWSERSTASHWNSNGTLDYQGLSVTLANLISGIPGRYQCSNAALALAAAEVLTQNGITIPRAALVKGIAHASWPGRMEMISGNPRLLLDGAHNPAGAAALADSLANVSRRKLLLVLGLMGDKDLAGIVSPLAPLADACYCVSPAIERSMDCRELADRVTRLGWPARPCGSVGDGITAARQDAAANDLILVCGSLFTVGEAKAWLAGTPFEGIRG